MLRGFARYIFAGMVTVLTVTTLALASSSQNVLFDEVAKIITENYINPQEIDMTEWLKSAKVKFQKACATDCSNEKSERTIRDLLESIHDPHLVLHPSTNTSDDIPNFVGDSHNGDRYGFLLKSSPIFLVVNYVQKGTPADTAGIQPGDTIISVNEQPGNPNELENQIRIAEMNYRKISLGIKRFENKDFTVKLKPDGIAWLPSSNPVGKDILLISIPSFFTSSINIDDVVHTIIRYIDPSSIKSIVFDLRHNDGGDPYFGINITGAFIEKIGQIFKSKTGFIRYIYENDVISYENSEKPSENGKENYNNAGKWTGKTIILVNKETFSGGENFAETFQYFKRGTVIGETTKGGGGVLANKFGLTTGAQLLLSTHRIFHLDETPLPLQITPDIQVPLDLDALIKGHDTQLEAAIKYLNETK